MKQEYHLAGSVRTAIAHKSRQAGSIPGVLYGAGGVTQSIAIEAKAFLKTWSHAGSSSIVTLKVADKDYPVLIHDVQLHPVKGHPMHVDMLQVRMDEEIRTSVPVVFTGESIAVKDLAGILVRSLDAIEIEALPVNLPHEITVDISVLKDFDTKIHVSDLVIPTGVKVLEEADKVVALVQPPRSEAELEELKSEVTEDVTAVEGVVKPEKTEEGAEGDEEKPEDKKEKAE